VILRLDAASGRIEKGTWMSAWLNPQHANGLSTDAACGDATHGILVAGNSAAGCPLKEPCFPYVEAAARAAASSPCSTPTSSCANAAISPTPA
jgi:hypothetical protein